MLACAHAVGFSLPLYQLVQALFQQCPCLNIDIIQLRLLRAFVTSAGSASKKKGVKELKDYAGKQAS